MNPMIDTQYSKLNAILLPILTLSILVLVTGAYEAEVMPKDEILISVISIILLLMTFSLSGKHNILDKRIALGFLIFNLFFIIRVSYPSSDDLEFKTYLIHIISLGTFISVYTTVNFILNQVSPPNTYRTYIIYLIITILAALLFSQLWQVHTTHYEISSRPGGYLNPNTTAAITLMLLYCSIKATSFKQKRLTLLALTLAAVIIFLAQSRASLLVFIPFSIYIIYIITNKNRVGIIALAITILLITSLAVPENIIELIHSALARFKGDYNSTARLEIIQNGLSAFLEAPLWGNGYRYLVHTYTLSAHNQIIEIMANFGLIGLTVISVAFFLLYMPFSALFFAVCIFPVMIFSHNFFDSYSFQAVLGFALAVDRLNNN